MLSHPTPLPSDPFGTTREAIEITNVDLKAKAKPCIAHHMARASVVVAVAQPSAETAKIAEAATRRFFLLKTSERDPLIGRIAMAAVARSPAMKPARATDAPSETA